MLAWDVDVGRADDKWQTSVGTSSAWLEHDPARAPPARGCGQPATNISHPCDHTGHKGLGTGHLAQGSCLRPSCLGPLGHVYHVLLPRTCTVSPRRSHRLLRIFAPPTGLRTSQDAPPSRAIRIFVFLPDPHIQTCLQVIFGCHISRKNT